MQGQSLSLLGHVSAVNQRYTREQKRFLVVTLDLLSGPMEVIVWPDVLALTEPVWHEGKLVRTTGKLRLRGDQFSLACDRAQEHSSADVTAVNGEVPPAMNGEAANTSNGASNGSKRRRPAASPPEAAPATAETSTGASSNGKSHRVVSLGVTESDDAAEDGQLLREVIGVLLEYPGTDRVNLEIHTGGRKVLMDLPVVSTGFCEGLRQRLESLLGPRAVTTINNRSTQ
jgi:hypothetical protein